MISGGAKPVPDRALHLSWSTALEADATSTAPGRFALLHCQFQKGLKAVANLDGVLPLWDALMVRRRKEWASPRSPL